ncbi:hypothetical protein A9Q99_16590 [Gammaproteobacteria bacterium 45_16_T64]|nr:hypothetical protein A9Q99_16590 [Gammaproteobacteria bacterium 45_16_T64]
MNTHANNLSILPLLTLITLIIGSSFLTSRAAFAIETAVIKEVLLTSNSKSSGGIALSSPQAKAAKKESDNRANKASHLASSTTWIYDADFDYITDNDGDGYYHRFRVTFDADTNFINDRIYAKLYLDNRHEEHLYYVSDDFTIIGNASSDRYEVTTSLTDGYDRDVYDIRIDIFDAFTHERLDSISANDDDDLYGRFLEEIDLDSDATVFTIQELSIALTGDFDNDGFYPELEVTVDADVSFGSEWVELSVFIIDRFQNTTKLYQTDEYLITGFQSADKEVSDVSLDAGYEADTYHIRAELRQASTGALLATSDTTRSNGLSIESKEYDNYDEYDDGHSDGYNDGHYSSTSEGHGGSFGTIAILSLGIFAFIRKRRLKKTMV